MEVSEHIETVNTPNIAIYFLFKKRTKNGFDLRRIAKTLTLLLVGSIQSIEL